MNPEEQLLAIYKRGPELWSQLRISTMWRMVSIAVLMGLLVASVCAVPGKRVRRGYNSGYGYGDSGGGYGRGSDERDASVSEEAGGGGGCGSGGGGGYSGRGYSGSRELAYNRDGRPSSETRGGRSFTKASASAAASATSFTQNRKSNIV